LITIAPASFQLAGVDYFPEKKFRLNRADETASFSG
jgi:hypothetical protein